MVIFLISQFLSVAAIVIAVSGGHCYCCQWRPLLLVASDVKNPATPLNIPRNSVNINTHKPLCIQQQLHFAPDQLLQLDTAKCLLYMYTVCLP
jgi:hypothetical protein